MLKLTYKELERIVDGDFDRFKVTYNKIPYDSSDPNDDIDDYIEDDGRQYRYCSFVDLETDIEYSFSYIWHGEFGFDFPCSILGDPPKIIEFVSESILYPPEPIIEPEIIKTPEKIADEKVWEPYKELVDNKEIVPYVKGLVPTKVIKDIEKFLKTEKFNIYQLRAKIIPVCVEYKVEEKSFWQSLKKC